MGRMRVVLSSSLVIVLSGTRAIAQMPSTTLPAPGGQAVNQTMIEQGRKLVQQGDEMIRQGYTLKEKGVQMMQQGGGVAPVTTVPGTGGAVSGGAAPVTTTTTGTTTTTTTQPAAIPGQAPGMAPSQLQPYIQQGQDLLKNPNTVAPGLPVKK